MTITIPVHSFVDLITNSSSEIFACADKSTITAIKKMLDNVLKAGGSTLTADDLFTIELGYEVTKKDDYEGFFVPKKEYDRIVKIYERYEGTGDDDDDDEEEADGEIVPEFEPVTNEYDMTNVSILVTPKDATSKEAKDAAKTLSDLTGLFEIDAIHS